MDLNADGHNDILSGSYSRNGQPMAGLFQVLWGQPDGTFKKAAALKGTDGKPLEIPAKDQDPDGFIESICTRPTAVDWDGDGDLDLVVGNFAGKFYLFIGEGGGKFAPTPQLIKAGAEPLIVKGHHGDPFLVDWDGDGDLDLLSGSNDGGVQWAENTAGPKKTPSLKPFAKLIAAPAEMKTECRPDEVAAPAGSTRVWAADVNGDGKLDILVGDNIALVSPAKGVSEADYKKRRTEWDAASAALAEETSRPPNEKDHSTLAERFQKLHEQRKEFMIEDRTGFVWVYLQK